MSEVVVSASWSGRWIIRSDELPHLRSRRDAGGDLIFSTATGTSEFRLVHRGRWWALEGHSAPATFRSDLHSDGVRRVWHLESTGFVGTAIEAGTGRSFIRQMGTIADFTFRLVMRSVFTIYDGAAPVGRIASRRILPISYRAQFDDARLDAVQVAALAILIGSHGN